MGLCGSKSGPQITKEDKQRSTELEKQLNIDQRKDEQVNKLLLLGAGESGKSTLFKQMTNIYGKGFTEEQRKEFLSIIFQNIVGSMQTLCEQSEELKSKGIGGTMVHPDLARSRQYLIDLKEIDILNEALAAHITALWKDPGIQRTYEHRSMYQLIDCAAYFIGRRIDAVAAPGYIPNEEDVLRCRARTTGIVESDFTIDGNQFKFVDVGGQRNERKKWIHSFDKVTAVLFVAALSAYDLVLFEDQSTNRMIEALKLFDEICNSKYFLTKSMILMLNKRDLFQDKIKRVPLTVTFPDYHGDPHSYDQCLEFIRDQFLHMNKTPEKRKVYVHVCCATDKSNITVVFNAIKDIIILQSLQDSGVGGY